MKIVIDIKGKEIPLEMKDAEELYNELGRIFGEKEKTKYIPYPVYPTWKWAPYQWWDGIQITTGGNTYSWSASSGDTSLKIVS